MSDHFVDKSYDIIVIKFETINFYRRVKDQNDGSWHRTEIFIYSVLIILNIK